MQNSVEFASLGKIAKKKNVLAPSPDLAKHSPLGPALVVYAGHAPHDSHEAVRVVAVQGVTVVEPQPFLQKRDSHSLAVTVLISP